MLGHQGTSSVSHESRGIEREMKRREQRSVCMAEGNVGTSAKTSMASLGKVALDDFSKNEYEEGR